MKLNIKLRPMSEAPKDGTEIFAVPRQSDCYGCGIAGTIDQGNFHPIMWVDHSWKKDFVPHWGMRWSDGFRPFENQYEGWFDPNDLKVLLASHEAREE
jgi:hypothetical protein